MQNKPAAFAAECEEAFKKIGDEELIVLCCDSWRLGGAMAEAVGVLQTEFDSQICSMVGGLC